MPEHSDFTFALVTDTHVGRESDRTTADLRRVIDEINESPAVFTIFCGDLVELGSEQQCSERYAEWLSIANRLQRPYYALPGNHDPLELFQKHVSVEVDFVFEYDDTIFICFDTGRLHSHDGMVSERQIDWIRRQLDTVSTGHRAILISHITGHPNSPPDRGWWIREENGGRSLNEVLREHRGQIAAWISGHMHCGLRGWDDRFGIHEIVLPSLAFNEDFGLADAPGWARAHVENAYAFVSVTAADLVLTHKSLNGSAPSNYRFPLQTDAQRSSK